VRVYRSCCASLGWKGNTMPANIEQPVDLGDVPVLNDEKKARRKLKMAHNKWSHERQFIEHVKIGNRRFYTDKALLAYLRMRTHKPRSRGEDEQRPST
jgi:hypothetical protein